MGWFGSGVNHEPYDKDGNPQTTGHESAAIVQSFGTNDLDHVLGAYAPQLTKYLNGQVKVTRKTYEMVQDLTAIVVKQNEKIDELTKKLNALER